VEWKRPAAPAARLPAGRAAARPTGELHARQTRGVRRGTLRERIGAKREAPARAQRRTANAIAKRGARPCASARHAIA